MKAKVTFQISGRSTVYEKIVNSHTSASAGRVLMHKYPRIADKIHILQIVGEKAHTITNAIPFSL